MEDEEGRKKHSYHPPSLAGQKDCRGPMVAAVASLKTHQLGFVSRRNTAGAPLVTAARIAAGRKTAMSLPNPLLDHHVGMVLLEIPHIRVGMYVALSAHLLAGGN